LFEGGDGRRGNTDGKRDLTRGGREERERGIVYELETMVTFFTYVLVMPAQPFTF
jgi:hypothetical protein